MSVNVALSRFHGDQWAVSVSAGGERLPLLTVEQARKLAHDILHVAAGAEARNYQDQRIRSMRLGPGDNTLTYEERRLRGER